MTNPVPFPTSESAAQQFTYRSPSGGEYVLHKLPATRYLELGNALVSYFGQTAVQGIVQLVKTARTANLEEIQGKSEAEMLELMMDAAEGLTLATLPMDAFQKLARLMCPFIAVPGKPPILPHERNFALVDAQIDMMFADHPGDVLMVVGRAIAFNAMDFFSAARLPLSRRRPTESPS